MNRLKRAIMESAVDTMRVVEPGTVTKLFRFQPGFIGFSGHFPGYPILPALVQMLMGLILCEEQKGRAMKLVTVVRAKFLSEIYPDHEILVQCRDCQIKGAPGTQVQLTVSGTIAASFSMTVTDKE